MLKIKNQKSDSAELYIYGDIVDDQDGAWLRDWDMDDGFEWPKDIKEQLDALKGKDLTIYINSNGGDVASGVAMANMIARHDGHTVAVVDSFCCSIATQIFFSADERKMPENTYLMIHKPWMMAWGDAKELIRAAATLDTIQEGLESTYRKCARAGVTAEQIHQMTEDETWLTGSEAAELFDIQVMEPLGAVACYGSRESLKALHNEKIPAALHFAGAGEKAFDAPPQGGAEDKDYADKRVKIALARAKGMMAR